jgi:predicted phage terminase large subunit-like protein
MNLPQININDIDYELCRRSYNYYTKYVHQDRDFKWGKYTDYLTETVQKFIETDTGHAYDILLVSVPPQHGKSSTITETLPSWYLGKNPTHRVIEISYDEDFAKQFTDKCHEKIDKYGHIFGIKVSNKKSDTMGEFWLDNGIGSFRSKGVSVGIAGYPCELMIIDDPIKNSAKADSKAYRDGLYSEWLKSYMARLAVGAKVIVIQTRWHKDDLYGRLMEENHNVTRINLPVICRKERDEIGRVYGDPLFPEMGKDLKWWEDYKQSLISKEGSRAVNALFYGEPSSDEGGLFKREWFDQNRYTFLPRLAHKIISVDATFKDAKTSDFVSIQVWGKIGIHYYLVERVKKIMGFVDTIQTLREVIARHSDYNAIIIEDKANGSAIIDVLKREFVGVIPIQPEGGKEARASAIAPIVESGCVHLSVNDDDMVNECCDFPNADHDDDVDAMSQALNRLRNVVAEFEPIRDDDYLSEDDQVNNLLGYTGR